MSRLLSHNWSIKEAGEFGLGCNWKWKYMYQNDEYGNIWWIFLHEILFSLAVIDWLVGWLFMKIYSKKIWVDSYRQSSTSCHVLDISKKNQYSFIKKLLHISFSLQLYCWIIGKNPKRNQLIINIDSRWYDT